jgi:hypothetical protein
MLQNGGNGSLPWMLAGMGEDGARYPDYDRYAFYSDDQSGRLIEDYSKRFVDAPACRSAGPADPTARKSPFVRARKRPAPVALGWVAPRG